MASVQVQSSVFSHRSASTSGKLAKSRSRTVVKPIFKKFHSHLERKTSLDLDRGWDEQPSSPGFSAGPGFGTPDGGAMMWTGRDVGFGEEIAAVGGGAVGGVGGGRGAAAAATPTSAGAGAGAGAIASAAAAANVGAARAKYSHVRSTSGNSHASSIATSASGRNGGSFVHPFQQIPQTSTPPLSYTNSRPSLDTTIPTGYSPVITEDDGDNDDNTNDDGDVDSCLYAPFRSTSSTSRPAGHSSSYVQQPSHRRPSLASQRTNSPSDAGHAARVLATRSDSVQTRLFSPTPVSHSKSELDTPSPSTSASAASAADSPPSSSLARGTKTTTTPSRSHTNAAPSSATPLSPLRNSLDMTGFRLRSCSEVDTATHQEHVREARRKFEAKERAKEEKYAREQLRKRERAESKEANRLEKTQSRNRKGSAGHGSLSSSAMSSGTDLRISSSKKHSSAPFDETYEKAEFAANDFQSTTPLQQTAPLRADEVHFTSSPKRKTAKHKTVGVWTAFVLWLRTRLLKLGRR